MTKAAVIGHVEWAHLVAVEDVPARGQVTQASEWLEFAAGGGCVAAVQLANLGAECHFYTAVGADQVGDLAIRQMVDSGVVVHAVERPGITRRAVVLVPHHGERTVVVHGARHQPRYDDALPWDALEHADVVLFTAGDAGALRAARRAEALVAVTRGLRGHEMDVQLDAVVGSGTDTSEELDERTIAASRLAVITAGERGGSFRVGGGPPQPFSSPALPGAIVDTYGAGDAFAAGLAFALGQGRRYEQAVALAALCGSSVVRGRGPYQSQITAEAMDALFGHADDE